jgi:hypothetical protein
LAPNHGAFAQILTCAIRDTKGHLASTRAPYLDAGVGHTDTNHPLLIPLHPHGQRDGHHRCDFAYRKHTCNLSFQSCRPGIHEYEPVVRCSTPWGQYIREDRLIPADVRPTCCTPRMLAARSRTSRLAPASCCAAIYRRSPSSTTGDDCRPDTASRAHQAQVRPDPA